MVKRIIVSVMLIASCSLQAMESVARVSASASSDDGSLADDTPDTFKKDVSNFVYKLVTSSVRETPVKKAHFVDRDTVRIVNCAEGERVHIIPLPAANSLVISSPDNKRIAIVSDTDVRIIDLTKGEIEHTSMYPCRLAQAGFNHDGRKLMVYAAGNLYITDAATGKLEHIIAGPADSLTAEINYAGTRLINVFNDKNICITDIATGKTVHTLSHHSPLRLLGFNHDDTKLVLSSLDSDDAFHVVDTKTGRILHTVAHVSQSNWAEFNHDDTNLTVKCSDGKIVALDLGKYTDVMTRISMRESILLKTFERAVRDQVYIRASPQQWQIWESLKRKLNDSDDTSDTLTVRALSHYIMKRQAVRRSGRLSEKAHGLEKPEKE